MSIHNARQLENTRRKLHELEQHRLALAQQSITDAERHGRELTLRSFGNLIKQLKEEIARYEAHATQDV